MKRLVTLLLILFCLGAAPAAPQQDELAKRFVGAWRLVSIEGGPPGLPGNLYDRPTGLIIYSTSGRVSAQIVAKADRRSESSPQPKVLCRFISSISRSLL